MMLTSFLEIIDVNFVAVWNLCPEFKQHSKVDSVQNSRIQRRGTMAHHQTVQLWESHHGYNENAVWSDRETYSLPLAYENWHRRLKKELRCVWQADRRELHMQEVVKKFDKELYGTVFGKCIHRHQQCVSAKGEYFEKLLTNWTCAVIAIPDTMFSAVWVTKI